MNRREDENNRLTSIHTTKARDLPAGLYVIRKAPEDHHTSKEFALGQPYTMKLMAQGRPQVLGFPKTTFSSL